MMGEHLCLLAGSVVQLVVGQPILHKVVNPIISCVWGKGRVGGRLFHCSVPMGMLVAICCTEAAVLRTAAAALALQL